MVSTPLKAARGAVGDAGSTPVSSTCDRCEHPFDWHGDRAVAACDGGWTSVESLRRSRPFDLEGKGLAACNCTGWVAAETL